MIRLLALAGLFAATTVLPATAQTYVATDRDVVMPAAGLVDTLPSGADSRDIYIGQPPGFSAGVWRFWIIAPTATAGVEIRDAALGRRLARIPAKTLQQGGWSPYLPSGEVFVRVSTASGAEVRLLSWPEPTIGVQTPVGVTNLDPVRLRRLPLAMRGLIRSVGLLKVLEGRLKDRGKTHYTYCTTFQVASQIAATAGHCVRGGLEKRYATLVLGYVDPSKPNGEGQYQVQVAAYSEALDLALLELERPAPGPDFFRIAEQDPTPGTELMMLQHFEGEPMSISDDSDCLTRGTRYDGPLTLEGDALARRAAIAFGHGCDTARSSSGSPVLDRQNYTVVGLHQQGYRTGAAQENRALLARFLTESLAGTFIDSPVSDMILQRRKGQ